MARKSFNTVAKQVKIENRVNIFIAGNNDEVIAVSKIEQFVKKYYLGVSCDTDEYMSGELKTWRKVWVYLTKLVLFIVWIRFAVSGLSQNLWIRTVTCDPDYLIGHPILLSVLFSIGAFCTLFIALVVLYQESKGNLSIFKFLNLIKHKRLVNRLHGLRYKRLILYFNLLTKYLLNQVFWSQIIFSNVSLFIATLLAYFDPKSGFSMLGVIFWSLMTLIWLIQFFGYIAEGSIIWIISNIYLKYQFLQINDKIKLAFRTNDQRYLIRLINDHHMTEKMTQELNGFFRYMILMIYYCGTPGIELLIYITHEPSTYFYARFVAVFLAITLFIVVFLLNFMSTSISSAAKKSRQAFHGFLSTRKVPSLIRLKLMNFVEVLSEKEIGFYCYDMFPMNNFGFYQYVYFMGITYFLILDLKFRFNI